MPSDVISEFEVRGPDSSTVKLESTSGRREKRSRDLARVTHTVVLLGEGYSAILISAYPRGFRNLRPDIDESGSWMHFSLKRFTPSKLSYAHQLRRATQSLKIIGNLTILSVSS